MKYNKEIFNLALPNILSNISVPLIASVDTALMGYQSTSHLAAVGAASMIFNFLYWNFGFLRMGPTGLVAQAYGKKDDNERSRAFFQAILISIIISSLLLILQIPLSKLSLHLMNLDGDLSGLASQYFKVRIWDAPATLMIYIVMAWFFGNQNAIIPLVLTIVINAVNIITSFIFVRYLHMGIEGVALGSVIGNYVGLIVGFIAIALKMPVMWHVIKDLKSGFLRFFQINRDIFIRTVMLSSTFFMLYAQSITFGSLALAVMTVLLQFINWMSYAIDGFAFACESLVGKYHGANNEKGLKKVIKLCFVYAIFLALFFSLLYGIFAPNLSRVFSSDHEVINYVSSLRWWLFLIPLVGFASYIWDGVFVGLTASKAMRNTMTLSFVFFLLAYYGTRNYLGFESLLLGLVIYLLVRAVAQSFLFYMRGVELK